MEQQEITVCAAITLSGPLVYHLIRWNVEIHGDQVLHVVLQKGLPRRGWWFLGSWAILLHGRFRHLDAQLPEFSDNPGRTPRRIGLPHLSNQVAHLLARGNGGVPSAQRLPAAAACSQAKRGAARRALGLDRRRRMG